jgi:transcriptional repressor NrdR
MLCIYCQGHTSVTNSRKQRSGQAIWRRRLCGKCGAIFTTSEAADLSASLMVEKQDGTLNPFSRDNLFFSIVSSCGHRKSSAATDASALTDTIVQNLLKQKLAIIPTTLIKNISTDTLERFDSAASTYYKAYFG